MKGNRNLIAGLLISLLVLSCAQVPVKQYYLLNYLPASKRDRLHDGPYPYTVRLKEFDIEDAYNRPQIVYRQSPFQLKYYIYRVWAVKPARMITDLVYKHLVTANLVSNIVRRFDESSKPDYELSGMIEALEEYDNEEYWFAHFAVRVSLVRIKDSKEVYTRRFDMRKRVFRHDPELVIREMSSLMELAITRTVHDMDVKFAQETGVNIPKKDDQVAPEHNNSDSTAFEEIR